MDLDSTSIDKDLACDGKSPKSKKVCPILQEFAHASRWSSKAPSGISRYVGRSYKREKGQEQESLVVLIAKVIPTAQVPVSYLPVVIGIDPLPKDLLTNGEKLVAALSRSDPPSLHNQALPWIDKHEPSSTYEVATTAGASVHMVATESMYLREVDRRKIIVISLPRALDAAPGDGTYTELWLASW